MAACGTPAAERARFANADPTAQLFGRAYEQVLDLYIERTRASDLALAGLKRLQTVDPKLSVERQGEGIAIRYQNDPIQLFPEPDPEDAYAWGALTSGAMGVARALSAAAAAKTTEELNKVAFDGIVASLDRYSRYNVPDVAREMRAARDGFGGIGVTLDQNDAAVRVSDVVPDGPAARAGVKAEDRILKIDGVEVAGLPRPDVIRRLRGPIETKVGLSLARGPAAQAIEVTVKRAFIVPPTVKARRDGDVGVFKITGFNVRTRDTLERELSDMKRAAAGRAPLRGLVIDLRGNPGGLLDQAVAVADLFITSGPIVSSRGRHPGSRQDWPARADDLAAGLPVVVVVDGGSASASEIVAAALQDAGRAVVIGSNTYGKGTVQSVLRLPNDGELDLTWARYHAPSGYTLEGHGVVPNVCTNGLAGELDEIVVAAAIRRGIAEGDAGPRPRVSLDEVAWGELRKSCPGQTSAESKADLELARRLIADPALFARAMQSNAPTLIAAGAKEARVAR